MLCIRAPSTPPLSPLVAPDRRIGRPPHADDGPSRYALRPPVAQDRLQWTEDGLVRLELRRPWSNGTTHLLFDPVELLERLAALTPRPRIHLILYSRLLE